MDESTKQEVFRRLDAVAEKLGVAAEHLWEVLVRQAVIEGWAYAVVWLAMAILLAATYPKVSRSAAHLGSLNDGPHFVACAIWGTTAVIGFAFAVFGATSVATRLLNPEYAAFRSVMDMIR